MEKRIQHKSPSRELRFELGSIAWFAFSVFLLVSLITYSSTDPSFFNASSQIVENSCGRVGAYLSALLLDMVGMGAFLVPAATCFLSVATYRKEGAARVLVTLSGMVLAVLALTVFLAIQWKTWPYKGSSVLTGGVFGVWLSRGLVVYFNPTGASIFSLSMFAVAWVIATPMSVAKGFAYLCMRTYFYSKYYVLPVVLKILEAVMRWSFRISLKGMVALQKELKRPLAAISERLSAPPEPPPMIEIKAVNLSKTEAPLVVEKKIAPFVSVDAIKVAPAGASSVSNLSDESFKIPEILPHEKHKQAELPLKDGKKAVALKPAPRKSAWKLPLPDFLVRPPKIENPVDTQKLYQNANLLVEKFRDFEIDGEVTAVRPGPVITLYEFKPAAGVKVSRIAGLGDDISMALSAQSVRVVGPLPGKNVVGIEIPSAQRENVFLREFIQHSEFKENFQIPVAMGKDIAGNIYFSDLAKMPHLLCAGQTGSGKSVFMNGLICSLLYRFTPDDLRLILVDPKMIEFSSYQDIPHLLLPVVDDSSQAATALKWAVREMERRYRILAMLNVRGLSAFNQRVEEIGADLLKEALERAEGEFEGGMERVSGGDWQEAFEKDEGGQPRFGKLPTIVIVIDELADLMMTAKKEVEQSIARIAQKARAAGIHLVIATQRPSTDVVTGLIKANLPSRVSFQLASQVDSKTILDRGGAERLLGRGDMFFIPPGTSNLLRLHGAYLSDEEINKITQFLRDQGKPNYRNEILVADEDEELDGDGFGGSDTDPMMTQATELVKRSGTASASYLQRHLRIGYNRAARLIEKMEEKGIVGPADGARPREVLSRF